MYNKYLYNINSLGLGLLYLGKSEQADVILEAIRTVEHKRGKYAEITGE